MWSLPLVIFITCLSPLSKGHVSIEDEDYKLLPPIYQMADYDECVKNSGNIYCTVDIKLKPLHKSSRIWELIEETKKNDYLYNHDEIYRTICMSKVYKNNSKGFVETLINKEVEGLNLSSTLERITCKEPYYPTTLDNLLMNVLYGYLFLILSATFYDFITRRKGAPIQANILTAFSLWNNYEKCFNENKNSHYQNLKCMQGIRTITCILVIWTHTKMSFAATFVENTGYIEHIYNILYVHFISDYFLTQIFSLISAWLLTVQVLSMYETNKEFTVKDACIITLNRICRLWPALAIVIYKRKFIFNKIQEGPLTSVPDTIAESCEKYWWYSFLFIQNYFNAGNVCNIGYWFISTDMQLYIVCIIILYVILKLRFTKVVLGISLLLSYGIFSMIIYLNDFDIVFRLYPEILKYSKFINDANMVYLYTMPYVGMSTYIIGVCLGIYYYKHRDQVKRTKSSPFTSMLLFFGLPALAIIIASRKFSGLSAALVGPLLKPIYAFSIGLGILNISQSANGIMKEIFEWRPLEFLSQFTYSTYIFHFTIVYLRTVMHKPLTISTNLMITSGMSDIIFGFIAGIAGYLLIELPWSNIQRMYVPQIKRRPVKAE